MNNKVLTEEDVKSVKRRTIIISRNNIDKIIASGGLKPVILSNGYMASLSTDIIREDLWLLHLSVSNAEGEKTDLNTAKDIAHDIFGDDQFETLGEMYVRNVVHFIKEMKRSVP